MRASSPRDGFPDLETALNVPHSDCSGDVLRPIIPEIRTAPTDSLVPTDIMPRRSRAREVVLQILYQEDLNPRYEANRIHAFCSSRLRNHDELVEFAVSLVNGVLRNQDELDRLLSEQADNWSLDRMAVTDRNILRLGAFEILYTEIPGRVAINEAVELAKRFGSGQSSQFVNGILDRFLPKDLTS